MEAWRRRSDALPAMLLLAGGCTPEALSFLRYRAERLTRQGQKLARLHIHSGRGSILLASFYLTCSPLFST